MSANKVTVSPTTNTITVASPGTVGPQGGTGAAGSNGADGTNGYSAHVGSGAPSNSLGAVNDIYFDNSNHVLYKKTGSTTWTSQGSYSSGSGGVNSFETISVAGQNNVVADSATDTLTLAAGSNVTLTTNDSSDTITVASTDTTANETITLSGDVTGSGTSSISATLSNSGVSAGTYGSSSLIPSITVDAKGRVTGVTTSGVSSSAGGTVSSVAISGSDGIQVDSGSPITGSGTIALGVDASALRTHLNIEDGADVTDATNVASAGAVMDTDFSSNGLMKRTGAGTYTVDANTYITDIVSDTTPQLGGNLDVNGQDIVSTSNANIDILPNGTGKVNLDGNGTSSGVAVSDGYLEMRTGSGNPAKIDMYCEVSNAHKVTLSAPPHSLYSGNVNFRLPPSNGTNNQVLKTDGSGNTSWVNQSSGGIDEGTAIALAIAL